MKEYIKYIPLGLFVAFCIKSLVVGVSVTEAPSLAIIAIFSAYLVHRDEEKQLKAINDKLNLLENKTKIKQKKLKTYVLMFLL